MSGSPVYINGRLIGAVSYSIGAFPKEPIAGITPIAEMKDATPLPRRVRHPAGAPRAARSLRSGCRRRWRHRVSRLAPFANRAADVQVLRASDPYATMAANLGPVATMLRPIATPLLLGGFEPAAVDLVTAAFRDSGFSPIATGLGGTAPQNRPAPGPLREGDAIGVALASGDFDMGATGTVTHIDGDRVYAFGHPLYNLGPAEFPFTRAYVHTDAPQPDDVVQDLRRWAKRSGRCIRIARPRSRARSASGPATVPMTVTLQRSPESGGNSSDGARRTFTLQVVKDQMFTPLVAYVAMFNTLASYERQFGTATFAIKSRAKLKGHGDLSLDDVFTGDSAMLGASAAIAGPLTMLLANDLEPITVEALDVSVDHRRNAAHRHHRARLARRSPAARGPHDGAQGPHAQLSRRGHASRRYRLKFRPMPPAVSRSW